MTEKLPPARIGVAETRRTPNQPGRLSALLLKHGTMELRWYAPKGEDPQTPHDQDEIYVVASAGAGGVAPLDRCATASLFVGHAWPIASPAPQRETVQLDHITL